MAVFFLTNRRFQAHRLLGNPHNFAHLVYRHIQFLGDLLRRRLMAVFMQQLVGNFLDFVDGLYHMHRNADGPCLIRDGAGNRLADPPGGISGKFKALGMVELLHSFDQAQVSLLNQIQKLHSPSHIAFGNTDDQPQIRL